MTARAALNSHITPRLKQLLLMLSSDQPGEVVAAANAIGRALRASGSDWHDLVANLGSAPSKVQSASPDRSQYDIDDWHALRDFCLEHRRLLRERELDFLTDLGDWQGRLTPKQTEWLRGIYARLKRAAA
jgi:hypothetical protein